MDSQALSATAARRSGAAGRHPAEASRRLHRVLVPSSTSREHWRDLGEGWAAVSYIITGVLLWGGVGMLLDHWIGIRPVLTVVGALTGNFAGIYLIYLRFIAPPGGKSHAP